MLLSKNSIVGSSKKINKHLPSKFLQGIVARDGLGPDSQATVIITSGGVGFPYVNIRMKSERGRGLNYHIELYYV